MEKITLNEFLQKDREKLNGKVFCFPTDTVYGLACLFNDQEAKKKIYNIKHRENKPLAILCSKISQITPYVKEISEEAKELMEKYWPGALTIIFEKNNQVISDLSTIAFRMPNSKISLSIIDKFGLVYATSVNYSGEKELGTIEEIEKTFPDIDYLITDYQIMETIPSTVVMAVKELKILRQGSIVLK